MSEDREFFEDAQVEACDWWMAAGRIDKDVPYGTPSECLRFNKKGLPMETGKNQRPTMTMDEEVRTNG